jgi:hypothetical protein
MMTRISERGQSRYWTRELSVEKQHTFVNQCLRANETIIKLTRMLSGVQLVVVWDLVSRLAAMAPRASA